MSNADGTPISPNEVRHGAPRPVGRVEPYTPLKAEQRHVALELFYSKLMHDCLTGWAGHSTLSGKQYNWDTAKLVAALDSLVNSMEAIENV